VDCVIDGQLDEGPACTPVEDNNPRSSAAKTGVAEQAVPIDVEMDQLSLPVALGEEQRHPTASLREECAAQSLDLSPSTMAPCPPKSHSRKQKRQGHHVLERRNVGCPDNRRLIMRFRVLDAAIAHILAFGLAIGAAEAQQSTDVQANNPLANSTAINFQNQYTGALTGSDNTANQVFLRFAQPFQALGGKWLMRATLPVNTFPQPSGKDITGIGDFNVFAAYLIDTGNPGVSFGIGPQVTAPTASEDGLGSGKW
jgi:hypothetical protein